MSTVKALQGCVGQVEAVVTQEWNQTPYAHMQEQYPVITLECSHGSCWWEQAQGAGVTTVTRGDLAAGQRAHDQEALS